MLKSVLVLLSDASAFLPWIGSSYSKGSVSSAEAKPYADTATEKEESITCLVRWNKKKPW